MVNVIQFPKGPRKEGDSLLDRYDRIVAKFEQKSSLKNLHTSLRELLGILPYIRTQIPLYRLVPGDNPCEYFGVANPDVNELNVTEYGLNEDIDGLVRYLSIRDPSFKRDTRDDICYLNSTRTYLLWLLKIDLRDSRFSRRFREITEDFYERCRNEEKEKYEEFHERSQPLIKKIKKILRRNNFCLVQNEK